MRVVAFIRNSLQIKDAKVESHTRVLTRASVPSSGETTVEQFLSIAKRQNKENLSWTHLLTRLQFKTLGPLKHEENALKIELMKRMKICSNIRATILHPDRRKNRNPHINQSKIVDNLLHSKARFRGFC